MVPAKSNVLSCPRGESHVREGMKRWQKLGRRLIWKAFHREAAQWQQACRRKIKCHAGHTHTGIHRHGGRKRIGRHMHT